MGEIFYDSSLGGDSMNSTSFKQNDLEVSSASYIIKDGDKDAAAIKVQKVYRSYRTRRILADSDFYKSSERWWRTLDSLMLEQNCFYDTSQPEIAISRWLRARLVAEKVGNGLSEDENALKLAIHHWLEAIDPRHRYGRNLRIYCKEWLKQDAHQPFFYWLDIGDGRDLNLQDECPRSTLKKELIKYLGPKERERYEVILQDGKLVYKKSRLLIDTTKGCGESRWIFVMSTSKKLYVGKKERGAFQHSSFLAGGATSAAGKLTVQDGVLKAIWPHSGHYRPTKENLLEFLNFLEENGIDIADIQKGSFSEEEPSIGVTKQESKKEGNQPIETLEANVPQETQSNTMDMDKNNNVGVVQMQKQRERRTSLLIHLKVKANILHEVHIQSNTLDEDKNNYIAPFNDEEQKESQVKSGMFSLIHQLESTEDTERTKTRGGKKKQDLPWIHKL